MPDPNQPEAPQPPAEQPPKRKVGRPSKYNLKIAGKICQAVATSSRSLKRICEDNPKFPGIATIYRWMWATPEFREMYESAKRDQVRVFVDELTDISDIEEMGQIITQRSDGTIIERKIMDKIERAKLKIDTRKWLLSKLAPREYGERTEMHMVNDPIAALVDQFREEHDIIRQEDARRAAESNPQESTGAENPALDPPTP